MPQCPVPGGRVVESETRDTGQMFDAELGVYAKAGQYHAYVTDGWGGGIGGPGFLTQDEAKADIPRLFEKFYGLPY